jgi:hypothetical protein
MHARVVEALAEKSAPELRQMFTEYLSTWKDDMVLLLFPEEG